MADSIFVAAQVYVNSKYVGQAEETELTFTSMGEQLISADQITESIGKVTTEGSIKSVVATDGSEVDLMQLTLDQVPVTLGFNTNGKSYQVLGKMIKGQMSSSNKTGTVKGTSNFRGGTPNVIPV